MVTEEDITDPDIRRAMEDGCDEYHQWLEEADLEDLPDDLELLIHFDNPHSREPTGSFISYQKEVRSSCCPMENEDEEFIVCRTSFISHGIPISTSGTRSTEAPVVVTVYPEQSFWQASELFPMHHARCHPNL